MPFHELPIDHDDETADRLARRPWPARPLKTTLDVSFEFFPPVADRLAGLDGCAQRLAALAPAFMSVTYGAGGTTQDRTLAALNHLAATTAAPLAGHLTCVGATRDEVHAVIDAYAEAGIHRIVALRGDPPAGGDDGTVAGGYQSAAELVAGIRSRPDGATFDISVAAYPEVHPRAASARSDLDNLKAKIDAGADRALTQFFYDNEAFLRFQQAARGAGIDAPIVPGIMPVTNFGRVSSFAARCGTVIPDWMPELFGGLDDIPEVRQLVAATVAAEQCRHLAEHGVTSFHFYTMNQPDLTVAVCRMLGVVGSPAIADAVAS